MIQAHYNIPKGSFNSVLEGIIAHLTPKGCSEYERIADTMLCDSRRLLVDESRGMRQAVFSWSRAGFMAVGLDIFKTGISKEAIIKLTNERYRPPSSKYGITDYIMTIYGTEIDIGKYPLSFAVAETAKLCRPNEELLEFTRIANEAGFGFAKKVMEEMRARNKTALNVPETEEALKKMVKDDEHRVYSDRLITDIQAARFFWDFIGRAVEKAGYFPERIEGEGFNSSQPALKEDLEMITAYPNVPAADVAEKMVERMVGNFTPFGVAVALSRSKDLPDPEYRRPG